MLLAVPITATVRIVLAHMDLTAPAAAVLAGRFDRSAGTSPTAGGLRRRARPATPTETCAESASHG